MNAAITPRCENGFKWPELGSMPHCHAWGRNCMAITLYFKYWRHVMFSKPSSIKRITLVGSLFAVMVVMGLSDLADARSSSGGRAFGGSGSSPSRSFGSPSVPPPSGGRSFSPSSPLSGGGGSSFLRGVGGGLVGGMIGNMLFGRSGYGGGSGGIGGAVSAFSIS